jgi:hypothetical protein
MDKMWALVDFQIHQDLRKLREKGKELISTVFTRRERIMIYDDSFHSECYNLRREYNYDSICCLLYIQSSR